MLNLAEQMTNYFFYHLDIDRVTKLLVGLGHDGVNLEVFGETLQSGRFTGSEFALTRANNWNLGHGHKCWKVVVCLDANTRGAPLKDLVPYA